MAFGLVVMSLAGLLRSLARRFNYISFEILTFIVSSIYIFAALTDYAIFDNTKDFSTDYLIWMGILGALFLISYVATITTVRIRSPNLEGKPREKSGHRAIFYVAILISALAFVFYLRSAGELLAAAYLSRADIYLNKSLGLDLLKFVLPISLLIAWIARRKSGISPFHFLNIILAGMTIYFIGFDVLAFGDRRVSLSLILTLAVLFYKEKKLNFFWLVAMVPLAMGTVLFGYIRNRAFEKYDAIFDFLSVARLFNPINTEFGPFHIVGRTLFEKPTYELLNFSLLAAPAALIPKRIYPDRPIAPSVDFVRENFADIYNAGGGLAYNMILEFFQNFWYFGPLILGTVLAYSFVILSRQREVSQYLYFLVMWNIIFFVRSDFVSLLRGAIISILVFIVVQIISKFLSETATLRQGRW